MQKVFLLFTFIVLTASSASASLLDNKKTRQMKNDLDNARTAVRKAVNLVEDTDESRKRIRALQDSERTIGKYMNDSLFRNNKDLRLVSLDLLKKQYDVYNDRLYLKMAIDTAAMARKGVQLLKEAESFDSLEAGKGYRKKHAEMLAPYHGNLLKAGIYFMAHKNWPKLGNVWTFFWTAASNLYLQTLNLTMPMTILLPSFP